MEATLTIQEKHITNLRQRVFTSNGQEGAAYLLCGRAIITANPWGGGSETKLLSHEVVPVPAEEIISASETHVTWHTTSFVRLLKRARDENLVIGIVHSHPGGFPKFSKQDDRNEPHLLELAQHRNGKEATLLSLLLLPDAIRGRLWRNNNEAIPLRTIYSVGSSINLEYEQKTITETPEFWHRQSLAFGPALNNNLRNLRVGIVGCGGTGSATAMLLGRLGVQQIALFDRDVVETTNLNRLHGATIHDAQSQRPKTEVVKNMIEGMGLGTHVASYQDWVGSEKCRDALRASDVIFGCTDDHDGRLLLNRLAYFYLIPVIDMGLAIDVSQGDPPHIKDMSGRVTVLRPGTPCLMCRRVIDQRKARSEQLQRSNPEEYKRQKREAYVIGEKNPNPAVVTFTTEVATMAINELIHQLNGFRTPEKKASQWTRRFHLMEDRPVGANKSQDCPICYGQGYWGRGDTEPFLDRVG